MVFIPPPHTLKRGPAKPPTQHDATVGMLVVFVILLAIALLIFIVGPRSHNPPPPLLGYVISALALLFGFIAFLSWTREQSDDDRPHPEP